MALQPEAKRSKLEFPKTLAGFGYRFIDGKLQNVDTGEGFNFVVKENNHAYNQAHYEALGEVMDEHIYVLLAQECGLQRVPVPIEGNDKLPCSFIFASNNWQTCSRLMILIHGSGVVRAGQWARRLIINDSLNSGTQLPYIHRAKSEGYGVLVLNTNNNRAVDESGRTWPIRGSEDPTRHADTVWRQYVLQSEANHIAIVAHSYGGCVATHLFTQFTNDFNKRVFAVALTDSVHMINNPEKFHTFMKRSRNWVTSNQPLDTDLSHNRPRDVPTVSAGVTAHEMTSWGGFNSVFEFFSNRYYDKTNERIPMVSEKDYLFCPPLPAVRQKLQQERVESLPLSGQAVANHFAEPTPGASNQGAVGGGDHDDDQPQCSADELLSRRERKDQESTSDSERHRNDRLVGGRRYDDKNRRRHHDEAHEEKGDQDNVGGGERHHRRNERREKSERGGDEVRHRAGHRRRREERHGEKHDREIISDEEERDDDEEKMERIRRREKSREEKQDEEIVSDEEERDDDEEKTERRHRREERRREKKNKGIISNEEGGDDDEEEIERRRRREERRGSKLDQEIISDEEERDDDEGKIERRRRREERREEKHDEEIVGDEEERDVDEEMTERHRLREERRREKQVKGIISDEEGGDDEEMTERHRLREERRREKQDKGIISDEEGGDDDEEKIERRRRREERRREKQDKGIISNEEGCDDDEKKIERRQRREERRREKLDRKIISDSERSHHSNDGLGEKRQTDREDHDSEHSHRSNKGKDRDGDHSHHSSDKSRCVDRRHGRKPSSDSGHRSQLLQRRLSSRNNRQDDEDINDAEVDNGESNNKRHMRADREGMKDATTGKESYDDDARQWNEQKGIRRKVDDGQDGCRLSEQCEKSRSRGAADKGQQPDQKQDEYHEGDGGSDAESSGVEEGAGGVNVPTFDQGRPGGEDKSGHGDESADEVISVGDGKSGDEGDASCEEYLTPDGMEQNTKSAKCAPGGSVIQNGSANKHGIPAAKDRASEDGPSKDGREVYAKTKPAEPTEEDDTPRLRSAYGANDRGDENKSVRSKRPT